MVRNTNTCKLNNTFLNNQEVLNKSKGKSKNFQKQMTMKTYSHLFFVCLTCPILRKIHCHSSTNILLFFIIVLMFCIKYVDIKLFGIIFCVAYDCYIFILDFMFHPCYIILCASNSTVVNTVILALCMCPPNIFYQALYFYLPLSIILY